MNEPPSRGTETSGGFSCAAGWRGSPFWGNVVLLSISGLRGRLRRAGGAPRRIRGGTRRATARARHLAAHRERRPPAQGGRERGAARVRLQLEHAPDEARAVEAAARRDARGR